MLVRRWVLLHTHACFAVQSTCGISLPASGSKAFRWLFRCARLWLARMHHAVNPRMQVPSVVRPALALHSVFTMWQNENARGIRIQQSHQRVGGLQECSDWPTRAGHLAHATPSTFPPTKWLSSEPWVWYRDRSGADAHGPTLSCIRPASRGSVVRYNHILSCVLTCILPMCATAASLSSSHNADESPLIAIGSGGPDNPLKTYCVLCPR